VPYWAATLAKSAVVGAHIFYRWAGGWGRPIAFEQAYSGREPNAAALRTAALSVVHVNPLQGVAGTVAEEIAKLPGATPDKVKAVDEFVPPQATYPNGTHVCEVEIDPDTGVAAVVRYGICDDFGMTLNPVLLAGQVHGGVAQGIGQALLERTVYGSDGQLLTASLMDYCMPRAADIPEFQFETRNVPSTTNPLGLKGAGEAGSIAACPAVMNAVVDALHRAYGIEHIDMPATPARVFAAIRAAKH
jgi:carbon-monoxide dehydrogenase large subunit